jgi:hypothetical protein
VKVSGDIPNLINGVSQQATALRLPTQSEVQENYYSTIVKGLRKRPPTEFVASILDELPEGAYFHIINRDADERYVVVITNEDLRVFDFDGDEKTVNFPDGTDYLASLDPVNDFTALTVADYTFIANRTVECEMGGVASDTRHPEAIVNIMSGNYGRTYAISINGATAVSYATPDGTTATQSPLIATTYIAGQLYDGLVAAGYNDGVTWGTGLHGNAIHILRWDDVDFNISLTDGANGNAANVSKDKTQRFQNLPNYGPDGFVIEVGNAEGTELDNYWVMADKGGSDQNSKVVWKEVTAPGTPLYFDETTMPHLLVREEDGTFTFKVATWDERKCGDGETISPDPSFIGSTIEDIVFHRNRLGFLADENIIFSRAGSFFDFWRTSATALLDDDPIDVSATHVKVSFLRHTIPHQDYLLLFSDQTQFRLAGNDLLTPKTVNIRPLTEFFSSPDAKPVGIGPAVFFCSDGATDEYAAVYEYTLDKAAETANADDVTAHVPAYIPTGIFKLTGSSDENLVFALTRGEPGSMFVYRYYWVNEEKVQSSWSKWTFGDAEILECAVIGSDLYLLMGRDGMAFLERMRLEPSAADDGLDMMVGLDQRVTDEQLDAGVFNASLNTTTYTLPYTVPDTVRAVVRPGGSGDVGTEVQISGTSDATLTLVGNTTEVRLFFGMPYESRYRFSTFYHRQPSQNGGNVAKVDGRLQLQHLSITYDLSAYFRVEVSKEGRDDEEFEMSGITVGSPTSIIGEVSLESGRFSIPLMARNDRITIDIVNDTWLPSNILAASWRGLWNAQARQV